MSIGCPNSLYPFVIFATRSDSDFIACRVFSYGMVFEGNDQTLPSGIDPKPLATLPAELRTVAFTLSNVT
jgi:hypothetical protein